MADLPVMLNVRGRRCVIVGGGAVAARRAASLREAGAEVVVIAPQVDDTLAQQAGAVHRRPYQRGDLDGACLVVVATDDAAVNEQVAQDAAASGVLTNRADAPERGDLTIPAHARHGPVTLTVHTDGISASAAAAIRRQLSDALDPDWPRLLAIAGDYRQRVQETCADPEDRRARLRRLTDDQAMNILKAQGDDALRDHLDKVTATEHHQ